MALRIQKALFDQLRWHGEQMYPQECCGVLVGEVDSAAVPTVRGVVPCGNACTNAPEMRYRISPADLVRIQREARLAGQVIVGFYHSHPDRPAQWSASDLAGAYWTGCSYVITSVEHGRAARTHSYLLQGTQESKRFEPEAIEVY
jgi:proteasome lid subunit RPN8/RPN11